MRYKRSICTRLSETEKEETIDALCLVSERIRKRIIKIPFDENNPLHNFAECQAISSFNDKIMDMWVRLFVGRTQQPNLKKFSRKLRIANESYKIAKETGASASEVEGELLRLMQGYIRY